MPSVTTHVAPSLPGSEQRLRMSGLAIVMAMLLLELSGCSHLKNWSTNGFKVGPDYAQPAAPAADHWIDFNDPRVISDRNGVDNSRWWSTFGDPQIEKLVWTAYRQNLPLKEAGLRVLEAQSQRSIATGMLFPQSQEAYADYSRIQLSKNGAPNGLAQLLPFRAFDFWNTGFNMSWELDVWGKVRRSIEAQDASLDANIENYDDVLVCLIAETVRAYIEIREFQQRLVFAHSNVAIQRESLRIAEARLKAGRSDQLDVAQAKATLYNTEALIPLLETGIRLSSNRLCILMGMPPQDLGEYLGDAPIPPAPPQVVVGIPAELLRRRPDVRKAEREVAVESARIGVATALLFPAFSIDGNLSWQSEKLSNLFAPMSQAGYINPGVNWQILNYGRITNLIEMQDAAFQRAAIHYQQVVLEAGGETEAAIKSFLEEQQRVIAFQNSVKETEIAVDLAQKKWEKAGPAVADYNRVANLQTALVVRQDALATSQARVAIELVKIYKALGGGWQIRLADCGCGATPGCRPLPPETFSKTRPVVTNAPAMAALPATGTPSEFLQLPVIEPELRDMEGSEAAIRRLPVEVKILRKSPLSPSDSGKELR